MKNILIGLLLLTPVCLLSQNRYDVVISEIMADPSPPVGLPANEWIELKNTSAAPINLQNWRFGDASSQSGPLPGFIIQPDSFVILCSSSAVAAMSAFGAAISVTSFPSLDNDGEQLFLRAANSKTIHAVTYSSAWYGNELKKEGGWTLEMIDPANPCSGVTNWKASTHTSGGTPGRRNAVDAINQDATGPQLKRAYTTDSLTIILVYDEPVDSLPGASLSNYTINGGLTPANATTLPPQFNTVQIKLASPLQPNTVYIVTSTGVKDCVGNMTGYNNKASVGLPVDPSAGDWIINEILFDPRSNAYDFAEFFNNSNKIFDASRLYIANRNSSGAASSIRPLSPVPFYIFPGDHIVVTEDADNLSQHYLVKSPDHVLVISSPPSFPDDEGTVVALNFQGGVVDEVRYKKDWHFKLIDNPEGVSLERIDPHSLSQDAANWHSAASTAGYGTPTYMNSQYKLLNAIDARIETSPKIFSPDNDGRDDFATIQYAVTEPGYVANITIFDAAGRPVRCLVRNGTMGLNGYWNWDGLDDKGEKLPAGIHIVFTEIFDLQGKKKQFRQALVLARKL